MPGGISMRIRKGTRDLLIMTHFTQLSWCSEGRAWHKQQNQPELRWTLRSAESRVPDTGRARSCPVGWHLSTYILQTRSISFPWLSCCFPRSSLPLQLWLKTQVTSSIPLFHTAMTAVMKKPSISLPRISVAFITQLLTTPTAAEWQSLAELYTVFRLKPHLQILIHFSKINYSS